MDFVMVPVPEEYVIDVMQYVARLVQRASLEPWDKESMEEFFSGLEEAAKSLLSIVARNTVADRQVPEEDAAKALELNVRELRVIMRDTNELAVRASHDPVLTAKDGNVVLPNGRTVDVRLLVMTEPVARLVRAAERADFAADELPSGDMAAEAG